MQDLTALKFAKGNTRFILIAAVIIAFVFGWFAIKWQLGNMMASLTLPDNVAASQAAEFAMDLAPSDPTGRWLRASIDLNKGETDASIRRLEDAVRLAPQDYRWRIELGRAYEQAERNEQAATELKKARELAPTYAFPRWALGNFYLRQGLIEEAFAELRAAAESNRTFREQVFSLAWDYFDKDAAKVEEMSAADSESRASLALFFAARGRASDSLRVWNSLSDTDKSANPQTAKSIALGLFNQRFFPQALEFGRQLGIDAEARAEEITNAGFERLINNQDDTQFGWRTKSPDPKLDIATDGSVKHEGARGLKVTFRNYVKPELYAIFQTVAVEPNRNYTLSFWVRTENLKSSGTPLIEVVNANDDKPIAASKAFKTGTNDWENYSVDFRTPDNCTGITIRTTRAFCGEQCPIAGVIWYDEFGLSGKQ